MDHLAVYRVGENRPPVVVLQYPGIDTGDFVLAAPLYPASAAKPIDVITPSVELDGKTWLVGVHLMAGIRIKALETKGRLAAAPRIRHPARPRPALHGDLTSPLATARPLGQNLHM